MQYRIPGIDPLSLIEREHYERTHLPGQAPDPRDTHHHAHDSEED